MEAILRIARATNCLEKVSNMYRQGLELEILGAFQNHSGFDGVMLGKKNSQYHLEFTQHRNNPAPRANSEENLLVFYVPDQVEWASAFNRLQQAGFIPVEASNPYWSKNGASFEDPEGYRVVINREKWSQ